MYPTNHYPIDNTTWDTLGQVRPRAVEALGVLESLVVDDVLGLHALHVVVEFGRADDGDGLRVRDAVRRLLVIHAPVRDVRDGTTHFSGL